MTKVNRGNFYQRHRRFYLPRRLTSSNAVAKRDKTYSHCLPVPKLLQMYAFDASTYVNVGKYDRPVTFFFAVKSSYAANYGTF